MKRILIITSSAITIALTGCLKDKPNVDFSSTQSTYIAQITTSSNNPTPNAPSGGLAYFAGANLSLPATQVTPDTIWFTVDIASDYAPTKDIPITLTVDQTALSTYDANPSHSVSYQLFPDSTFTMPTMTGTVKAGQMNRLDTFYVIFYPWKVDPATSYMLPLTITQAPGCTISANLGTIYFHVVGNPLAGPYNDSSANRYNYAANAGMPAYSYPGPEPTPVSILGLAPYFPKFASPNSPTEILVPYANNLGNYIIDFDGSYNLTVTTDVTGITGFTVFYANYNPATKTLHLVTGYINGTPAARIVDETMVHQ
jgi:hypothetical protein